VGRIPVPNALVGLCIRERAADQDIGVKISVAPSRKLAFQINDNRVLSSTC
jgi:hypothetical protein